MVKNDKIDALIMLSGDVLVQKNIDFYKSVDTSNTVRPKSLDRRVQSNINKENRKQIFSGVNIFARRIAVAILILCTLSFAVVMAVEPLREALWSVIVDFFDDYMTVTYVAETEYPYTIEETKEINLDKEDWEKQVVLSSDRIYYVNYSVDGILILSYSQEILGENEPWIDNQNSIVKDVKVGNYPATIIFRVNQQTYSICWNDGNYSYILDSHSPDISGEELIFIAEKVE